MTSFLGLPAVFPKRDSQQQVKIARKKKKRKRKREKCKKSGMRINKTLGERKGGSPCIVPKEF